MVGFERYGMGTGSRENPAPAILEGEAAIGGREGPRQSPCGSPNNHVLESSRVSFTGPWNPTSHWNIKQLFVYVVTPTPR